MIRDLLKKVFTRSKKPESDAEPEPEPEPTMGEVRGEAHDMADELTPGHSDRAASIGVFHN